MERKCGIKNDRTLETQRQPFSQRIPPMTTKNGFVVTG